MADGKELWFMHKLPANSEYRDYESTLLEIWIKIFNLYSTVLCCTGHVTSEIPRYSKDQKKIRNGVKT